MAQLLTTNALRNDGTMNTGGGGGGGSVTIEPAYPPTSNRIDRVPSTSVVTSLFNAASPAGALNHGTTATGAVTVGAPAQTLTLNGSSLTVLANFFEDLEVDTDPSSTATNKAATPNMVYNLYWYIMLDRIPSSWNFGTTAFGPVKVGNNSRTLTLAGSSLTVPSNFFVNLTVDTAPTSTSITQAATANSLTVAYNKLNAMIGGGGNVTTNNAFGTAATSPVTVGNVAQTLQLNGSTLTVPSNFFVNLTADTAPTSTSTTSAATANSLTVAYNKVVSLIPTVTVGPAGPAGPTGATGPAGPAGPSGSGRGGDVSANTSTPGYDIIVVLGQSNSYSHGSIGAAADPVLDKAISDVPIFFYNDQNGSVTYGDTEPVPNSLPGGLSGTGSPIFTFAKYYGRRYLQPGRKILLVVYGQGSTNLVGDGSPWSSSGGSLFNGAVSAIKNALNKNVLTYSGVASDGAVSSTTGQNVNTNAQTPNRVAAIIWSQGEDDSGEGVSVSTYASAHYALIDSLRTTFGSTIPFIITGFTDLVRGGALSQQYINNYFNSSATNGFLAKPITGYAPGDGLGASNNGANSGASHFNQAEYRRMGVRVFKAYQDALNNIPAQTAATFTTMPTTGTTTIGGYDGANYPVTFNYAVSSYAGATIVVRLNNSTGTVLTPTSISSTSLTVNIAQPSTSAFDQVFYIAISNSVNAGSPSNTTVTRNIPAMTVTPPATFTTMPTTGTTTIGTYDGVNYPVTFNYVVSSYSGATIVIRLNNSTGTVLTPISISASSLTVNIAQPSTTAFDQVFYLAISNSVNAGSPSNTTVTRNIPSMPTAGAVVGQFPPSAMTASTQTITGRIYTASASSTFGGFTPHTSFDYNAGNGWASANTPTYNGGNGTSWLQLQTSVAQVLSSYQIAPYSDTNYLNLTTPNTWELSGSNDGTSWTIIDGRSNITGWVSDGTNVTFKLFNVTSTPPAYTYFRLLVTKNNGGAWVHIGELKLIS